MSPGKVTFLTSSSGAEGGGVGQFGVTCLCSDRWYCRSVGSGQCSQIKPILWNLGFLNIWTLRKSTLATGLWKGQLVWWVGGGGKSAFNCSLLQLMFLLLSRTHQTVMMKVSCCSYLFPHPVQQCECLLNAPSRARSLSRASRCSVLSVSLNPGCELMPVPCLSGVRRYNLVKAFPHKHEIPV